MTIKEKNKRKCKKKTESGCKSIKEIQSIEDYPLTYEMVHPAVNFKAQ